MAGDDRDNRDNRDDDRNKDALVDPDRAAILARRRRFIAMALTGLTATAAGCDDKKPKDPTGDAAGEGKAADDKGGDDSSPHPCLKVEPTPQPCLDVAVEDEDDGDDDGEATPVPCLEIAVPPEPEGGSSGGNTDDGADKPVPKPCLRIKKPDPEPEPKPTPCLKVAAPKDDPAPKPAPKPCLKVQKPD